MEKYMIVIKSKGVKYYFYDTKHEEFYIPPFDNYGELERHIELLFYNFKKENTLISVKTSYYQKLCDFISFKEIEKIYLQQVVEDEHKHTIKIKESEIEK